MKIGIMGAMREEVELLLPMVKEQTRQVIGQRTFVSGLLEEKSVVVVYSRMGKVAAASTATVLINSFGCDIILFTGVAGALDKNLNIGDIVIGSSLVQHDMDASALQEYKRFQVPLGNIFFKSPRWLADKAQEAALYYLTNVMPQSIDNKILDSFGISQPKVVTGLIASGDQFIASKEVSDNLLSLLPEIKCVEMEGAAVAQVTDEYDIPLVVLRTISDKADHSSHIDFPKFVDNIATNFTCGSLLELVRRL